jgi:soluble lytic murein transglycosylase-like protein
MACWVQKMLRTADQCVDNMKRSIRLGALIVLAVAAIEAAAAGRDAYLADLEAAARQGNPAAQTELATRYEYAEGVPKDLDRAQELFCRAARQGFAEAQFQLGWMYANGRGVARDDSVAAALFKLAASAGHEYAARLLSYVHPSPDAQLPTCLRPDPSSASAALGDAANDPREQAEVRALVYRLAPEYRVDPKLALAVIRVESGFDDTAVSTKNARGLMQLTPETAQRFGVRAVFDPVENVRGGLAYLRWLLAYFQGDVRLTIAAYNAGEKAVEKYRGIPPYPETRDYVRRITTIYKRANHPFDGTIVNPSPTMRRTAFTER